MLTQPFRAHWQEMLLQYLSDYHLHWRELIQTVALKLGKLTTNTGRRFDLAFAILLQSFDPLGNQLLTQEEDLSNIA